VGGPHHGLDAAAHREVAHHLDPPRRGGVAISAGTCPLAMVDMRTVSLPSKALAPAWAPFASSRNATMFW
jgi:hypothetical protein